ncbi:hypothetical protein HA402_007700 [Bradysia odoriphaga]|nr:hypothetical protein HA402_007700 [Bradysia odoriphaga]
MKISVLVTVTLVTANIQVEIEKKDNFALALTTIITDFYVMESNTIAISQCSTSRLDITQSVILSNILANLDENISITWTINDDRYLNRSVDFINNLIFTDSYESWLLISKNIVPKSLDYFGYYTVVITQFYKDHTTIVNNILHDCWKNDILNVNILTYEPTDAKEDLILYTYFPFTPSNCGNVVPVIWNRFQSGRFDDPNNELFPMKTENFHQCPISILVNLIKPLISVKKTYPNDTYDFEGIEYNVLQTLSERINFTPVFSIHWDDNVGMVYENGTVSEALGEVFHRNVNITVGGLVFTPADKKALSATKSYLFDNIIFVVPNASPYTSFEKLFFPFTLSMWTLILVVLMGAIVVIKILQLYNRVAYEFVVGEKNNSPYLNLISVLITGGVEYEPRTNFAKFLLILWILACFILQTVYQGELFTFIKMNKMKASVRSIDELIERNIAIKLIKENYYEFLEFDQRMGKILKFVDAKLNSEFEYVTENEGYVTLELPLVDETRRKSYENGIFERPQTLKVVTCSHSLFLAKNSFLKHPLDDEITYMNENGLTEKWNAPYKLSTLYDTTDVSTPRKLNLSQLIGIIEMCFGLLLVATVVFIFEILSPY